MEATRQWARAVRREALRGVAKAQKERASLTRLGLKEAAARANARVQGHREVVRQLTAVLS